MPKDQLARLRAVIRDHSHIDEADCVHQLLQHNPLDQDARERVRSTAVGWVELCRAQPEKQHLLDAFFQEYNLSNHEGVALLSLAEALLRVADARTADYLIAEKIRAGDWSRHQGQSEKLIVNAATWALRLAGRIVHPANRSMEKPPYPLHQLLGGLSGPAVRFSVRQAMKWLGRHYVLGRTIAEATARGLKELPESTRFSYDMLGEGARTYRDAERYIDAYRGAIQEIGRCNNGNNIYQANGISVKLSALHPRFNFKQRRQLMAQLLPQLLALARLAREYNIGFTIDAEEAARLELTLDIFQALAESPQLHGWDGFGLVVQTYQKRALYLIDWLAELAHATDRRLMVRLVKGAYWDSEIKHAQTLGLTDYPVFTRKAHSDLSYQVCAARLLVQREYLYPQFATHNAYTIAMLLELLGGDSSGVEFQRLHGMGELLYATLGKQLGRQLPLRVYAPVGHQKELLPYLVRRLLENGANSSFVNQFLDPRLPASDVVRNIEQDIIRLPGFRHSKIPLPRNIYRDAGDQRDNARGINLDDPQTATSLEQAVAQARRTAWRAGPIIGGALTDNAPQQPLHSPANIKLIVGYSRDATPAEIDRALALAAEAQPAWQNLHVSQRAAILERAAAELECQTERLTALISLEAGKTLNDGIAEVREAVDFCRYYANQIRNLARYNDKRLLEGRGVFVCISPWNFPLAIFIGQISAALVTGNAVIAKPAEQTPLIAAEAVAILHRAGVPGAILQLLPGIGEVIGPALLCDHRVSGVAFTGATETALRINSELIKRGGVMPPLIAETGGQNVMLVDSTALPEQVVDDVIDSAFLSAGQRCSALRVLFLQEEVAARIIELLQGALKALRIGEPWRLDSDLGPVIDAEAKQQLLQHLARMDREAVFIGRAELSDHCPDGHYLCPHIYQLNSISQLQREVFGPILHIIRYRATKLPQLLAEINATGYGLTLGVHSRRQHFAEEIFARTRAGNTYSNRNMVGAVVGVNPFGGSGLSGTGFKAGGPHYLLRFTNLWRGAEIKNDGSEYVAAQENAAQRLLRASQAAQWRWNLLGGKQRAAILSKALGSIAASDSCCTDQTLHTHCRRLLDEARTRCTGPTLLPGPAGERNSLSLHGRGVFLIYPDPARPDATLRQMIAALAAGNTIIIAAPDQQLPFALVELLNKRLPEAVCLIATDRKLIYAILRNDHLAGVAAPNGTSLMAHLGERQGPIIPLLIHLDGPFTLLPYCVERTYTDNVAATGGNALLLNLQE